MAENSKIEWTDATWNPMAGCSIVSPGCHNCYAMRTAYRLAAMGQKKYQGTTEKKNGRILWTGKINTDESALSIPLKKKKPTTWFVNSMSDLFHESVPFDFIDKVFAVMALCPQHTFQILTKRPERMAEYTTTSHRQEAIELAMSLVDGYPEEDYDVIWPLPNVWLGTSCEDQQRADERIPHLLRCPAAVRFVSAEPLLGPIDLGEDSATFCHWAGQVVAGECEHGMACRERSYLDYLDWVIVGGESGPGARPCDLAWIRSIVGQCREAGVACFVKQLGANAIQFDDGGMTGNELHDCPYQTQNKKGGDISEWPEDLRVREMPHVAAT